MSRRGERQSGERCRRRENHLRWEIKRDGEYSRVGDGERRRGLDRERERRWIVEESHGTEVNVAVERFIFDERSRETLSPRQSRVGDGERHRCLVRERQRRWVVEESHMTERDVAVERRGVEGEAESSRERKGTPRQRSEIVEVWRKRWPVLLSREKETEWETRV